MDWEEWGDDCEGCIKNVVSYSIHCFPLILRVREWKQSALVMKGDCGSNQVPVLLMKQLPRYNTYLNV